MLRSFRFENHRSFRDEAELVLLPVFADESRGRRAPVPVAAIFGANAAGKSNVLDGLRFMGEAVEDSYRAWSPRDGVPRKPFRLGTSSVREPSTYVVEIEVGSVRFTYGFVVDDETVLEEWVYSYPKGKRRRLFERSGTDIEFGESLGLVRGKVNLLAELLRPNALFLSLVAQVRQDELAVLKPVYDWFTGDGLTWSSPSRPRTGRDLRVLEQRLVAFLGDSPKRATVMESFIRAADVGIEKIVVEQPAPRPRVDPEGRSIVLENPRFKLRHVGAELFDLWDESDGTLSWLTMLPGVLAVLDSGGLLVIDEIDSSLHPNLTVLLIKQFRSQVTNPQGAQLLFTTHDASLLGTSFGEEILGRDQVWFVEKGADGASSLYPLSDFRPRAGGENRERRYLAGSYGAVPLVDETLLPPAVEG
ncbi:MAG: hypothetical protein QG622_75 [Actinomycetota bacterium]|nr:hypothetical protein [Actinomycetota bacterium]